MWNSVQHPKIIIRYQKETDTEDGGTQKAVEEETVRPELAPQKIKAGREDSTPQEKLQVGFSSIHLPIDQTEVCADTVLLRHLFDCLLIKQINTIFLQVSPPRSCVQIPFDLCSPKPPFVTQGHFSP